jgi:hypothetical protein
LHQRVGEWLEHTYGAQVAAIAGPLAWHFEEAGDDRRAIRYLILTAQNAAERFAFADAIRVLEHARTLARHLPAHTGLDVEIELLQRIGDAQSALSTAEPNLQALAWDIAARVAMAEEDWKAAEEHIEKGLAVLQKFAIPATAWMLHATRSSLYRHVKNHTAAENPPGAGRSDHPGTGELGRARRPAAPHIPRRDTGAPHAACRSREQRRAATPGANRSRSQARTFVSPCGQDGLATPRR